MIWREIPGRVKTQESSSSTVAVDLLIRSFHDVFEILANFI